MEVLVTGAGGVLGKPVAAELERRGHVVRHGSRRGRDGWIQADALKPTTLAKAAKGVDAIVHCAANAFGKSRKIEVDALGVLRKAAPEARIVYPSIVGVHGNKFGYYKVKVAAEDRLTALGGDHCIVPLTQFFEFADRLARLPIPMLPKAFQTQPISVNEAALAVVDALESGKQGRTEPVGGPEIFALRELVKQRLAADGRRRPILQLPVDNAHFGAGHTLCPEHRVGKMTWAEHLANS